MVMIALGLGTRLTRLGEGGVGWRLGGLGVFGLLLSSSVAYALVASSVAALAPHADDRAAPGADSAMLASPGGRVFSSVGCAKCHVPSMRGHDGNPVTLYSDLLLHDMGPATASSNSILTSSSRSMNSWGGNRLSICKRSGHARVTLR